MQKFRLNRRAMLRGGTGVAIALPWLECMEPERSASAQAAPTAAKRFISVYQPGGSVLNDRVRDTGQGADRWTPTGSEMAPVLSPILAPLEPVKSKIALISGLNMSSAVGEQHQRGIIAWLTGGNQVTFQKYSEKKAGADFASIDQVIATRISKGKLAVPSVQMAVRWGTGKSYGLLHPINSVNFEDNSSCSPIPPLLDPVAIWNKLFENVSTSGTGTTATTDATAARLARKRSILDLVDKRYDALAKRVGATDRLKLEEHLTKIREIENGLMISQPSSGCVPPILVNTSDYKPKSGLNSASDGSIKDTSTDSAIPKVAKLMMDMIVMAMACDITAVASLQYSDTEAKHTFPWLSLPETHHFYQHDGGFNAAACEKICTWYSTQHLYLVQQLGAQVVGTDGHTLLDESVVFFGSELQKPDNHSQSNMPFMLAGNGGGMRTGRWMKYSAQSHNNLLVSILNLFGDPRTTYGANSTGPLKSPTLT